MVQGYGEYQTEMWPVTILLFNQFLKAMMSCMLKSAETGGKCIGAQQSASC